MCLKVPGEGLDDADAGQCIADDGGHEIRLVDGTQQRAPDRWIIERRI